MSKVLWHITMSLDGFVAGPGDDMGWLFSSGFDPDPRFVMRTLNQIGAVLIGHRTYHGGDGDQGAKSEKGEPYGGAWHGPRFVYTRDDPGTAAPGFTFVSDIKQAVQLAKDAAGEKYVSLLGPGLAAKVLDAGLVDEILVHIAPVLLGDGKRLYEHPGAASIRLEPTGQTPQITNLWMRVEPSVTGRPGVLPGE